MSRPQKEDLPISFDPANSAEHVIGKHQRISKTHDHLLSERLSNKLYP